MCYGIGKDILEKKKTEIENSGNLFETTRSAPITNGITLCMHPKLSLFP